MAESPRVLFALRQVRPKFLAADALTLAHRAAPAHAFLARAAALQLVRCTTSDASSRAAGAVPPSEILVRERHHRQWHTVRWRVGTQVELKDSIGRGRLLEVDSSGAPLCSVVSRAQLRPGATYVFKEAETTDVEGAVRNLAAGHVRESTAALAADARLRDAFGALRLFNGGEPYTFRGAGSPVLQADGVVLPEPQRLAVLLNEAKLAPAAADVDDVVNRALLLQLILRGTRSVANFPPELQAYRAACVVPCLSGIDFEPRVLALAVAQGVVPVVCSGSRFHVAPQAPDPLSVMLRRHQGERGGRVSDAAAPAGRFACPLDKQEQKTGRE